MDNSNEKEVKAMLKGAILYRYGKEAALNTEVIDSAWDCYSFLTNQEKETVEEAFKSCVDDIVICACREE